MAEPLGPVVIGAREIYDAVVRMGGKLDLVAEQHTETRAEVRDHEARIRVLERARWPLPSLAALISIASLVIAAVALAARH
jgi:hypothetical protein